MQPECNACAGARLISLAEVIGREHSARDTTPKWMGPYTRSYIHMLLPYVHGCVYTFRWNVEEATLYYNLRRFLMLKIGILN